jgi:CHAT domain-containing protein
LERQVSAEALQCKGVTLLLAGKLDSAAAELARAAELFPDQAEVFSDLSVAHLARAASTEDPHEFVLALAAANRAIELKPALAAGRFNHALALERLSLRTQAVAEWKLLLTHEQDAGWRREARLHAAAASAADLAVPWRQQLEAVAAAVAAGRPRAARDVVRSSPQAFREYVEETLLPRWAVAELGHRESAAATHLAMARTIASDLATRGERTAAETIAQIDRLRAGRSPGVRELAAGFVAYGDGLELLHQGRFTLARRAFETAMDRLVGQRSPFAPWPRFQIALCHYQVNDYPRALAQLRIAARSGASYPALTGRCLAIIGLIQQIEGSTTGSFSSFAAAERCFRRLGETANAERVATLIASDLGILGQLQEAWRWLYPALVEPAAASRPENRRLICEVAAWLAQVEGEGAVAFEFQDEVVRTSWAIGRAELTVGALRGRAALFTQAGNRAAAARDLAAAWQTLERIPDPRTRESVAGDLALVEGENAGVTAPRESIAWLDRAIRTFRATSYHFLVGRALYRRALAEGALHRDQEMERDLDAALVELERQRGAITKPEYRISYFDQQKEIFDAKIAFQLRRHRVGVALATSEQARARVLWDWLIVDSIHREALPSRWPGASARALESSLARLPGDVAVIEYAVLPRQTVIWLLRRSRNVYTTTVEIRAEVLAGLVQRLRSSLLEERSAEFNRLSGQLYQILVGPLAGLLKPVDHLVFVPDGALHKLPFALLREPRWSHYLVQDHACSAAPSLAMASYAFARGVAPTAGPSPRVMAFVAPEFDRDLYPDLQRIEPGDIGESLARWFTGSLVLSGRAATRASFLRSAGDFDILYFGGHSVINVEHPLRSQMVFATHADDPTRGVVYSEDVLGMRFQRTRLAVLASCSTGLGKISRSEGVENLARAFLAAGVPAVVASLWPIEDAKTDAFFGEFFRTLHDRYDVAGALRAAQLGLIERSAGSVAAAKTWGAFEVIGYGGDEPPPERISSEPIRQRTPSTCGGALLPPPADLRRVQGGPGLSVSRTYPAGRAAAEKGRRLHRGLQPSQTPREVILRRNLQGQPFDRLQPLPI